ncbi:MAG: hypothetical protein ABEJ83_00950 [Candidatus Nanohaloarchaea archaeon]
MTAFSVNNQEGDSDEVTLEDVHSAFDKWMEIEDMNRIDIMLATHLSNLNPKQPPIWIILIGPSGDGKTEQLKALRDPLEDKNPEEADTKKISEITKNTLVSGMDEEGVDLAPTLDGKTILIYDFATLLNKPAEAKKKIMSQFRELYDGEIGKQAGSGKDVHYTLDHPPSLIACSTPDFDNQIIQVQQVGTRELMYRLPTKNPGEMDAVLDAVLDNHARKSEMRDELQRTVRDFIETRAVDAEMKVPEWVEEQLKALAKKLSILRAEGRFEHGSSELMNDVTPEVPSRTVSQLKAIFISLKSLEPDYSSEKALEIINHIVESSGKPRRSQVLNCIAESGGAPVAEIADEIKQSYKMVKRDVIVLWNCNVLEKDRFSSEEGEETEIWRINSQSNFLDVLNFSSIWEQVERFISSEDDGEGVSYEKILKHFDDRQDEIEQLLDRKLKEGVIHEVKPGKVKLV